MNRGFYIVMAAQFFSSLADNALLIAAIALLRDSHAPEWMTPMLKLFFFVSYVVTAAFVGAFADSMPKGRVMLWTNGVKLFGATLMLIGLHPLLAYSVVGLGAAAYSPAKYGIVTEMLPADRLVAANGWIEGLTVGSIILGFVVGGVLISPRIGHVLLNMDVRFLDAGADSVGQAAIAVIAGIYGIATAINFAIPDTGARYPRQLHSPLRLVREFGHCLQTLWTDRLGQVSLSVTTLFWGAGATLQFIVLKWSEQELGLSLSQGAILQAVVAVGVAIGAVAAASAISLRHSLRVLPVGVAMGCTVALLALINFRALPPGGLHILGLSIAWPRLLAGGLMVAIGAMAGFFVVPMNALLQHRGHVLLSAGHSIAVQNFNENLSILLMLGLYTLLISLQVRFSVITISFGLFVALTMALVMLRHRRNQREFDSEALIGQPLPRIRDKV